MTSETGISPSKDSHFYKYPVCYCFGDQLAKLANASAAQSVCFDGFREFFRVRHVDFIGDFHKKMKTALKKYIHI